MIAIDIDIFVSIFVSIFYLVNARKRSFWLLFITFKEKFF